jgi:hypothetical protein
MPLSTQTRTTVKASAVFPPTFAAAISWTSRKLKHVGTHVGQNETMSQTWAGKNSAWVRFLMEEINHKPAQPVDLFGDDDQTNRLGQESMMATCNRQSSSGW